MNIINVKLGKSGPLATAEIIAIARSADIDLMIDCMLESAIGIHTRIVLPEQKRLKERLQAEVDTSQTVCERADMITDIDAWKARQQAIPNTDTVEVAADLNGATDDEVRQMWIDDLVYWMGDLGRAEHVGRVHAAALQSGDYDSPPPDEQKTAFNTLHSNLHEVRGNLTRSRRT
jgi:hypothetical protein